MRPPALMRGPEEENRGATAPAARRPRNVHEGGQSGIVAPAQRKQALGNKGAVEPCERHHVGDGAECNQIEVAKQIGLGLAAFQYPRAAQLAIERDHGHEDEPDRGEMAEPRRSSSRLGLTTAARREAVHRPDDGRSP